MAQQTFPSQNRRPSDWKPFTLKIIALALFAVGINLAIDSTYCVVPPCLTKWSAYRSIRVGMNAQQAELLLYHAGIFCPGQEGPSSSCTHFTFADFSRDYLVEIDSTKQVVRLKRFGFRLHGKGLLEFIHILR
jgi:hypothetical protein